MIEVKVYVVYDSKAEVFGNPILEETRRDALENWRIVANGDEKENKVAKFPADFTLFEIGTYSRLTGSITMYEHKVSLGTALQHKNNAEVISAN